jgi:hypothetical protein
VELDRLTVHARTPLDETGLHLSVECGDGLKALRIVKVQLGPREVEPF